MSEEQETGMECFECGEMNGVHNYFSHAPPTCRACQRHFFAFEVTDEARIDELAEEARGRGRRPDEKKTAWQQSSCRARKAAVSSRTPRNSSGKRPALSQSACELEVRSRTNKQKVGESCIRHNEAGCVVFGWSEPRTLELEVEAVDRWFWVRPWGLIREGFETPAAAKDRIKEIITTAGERGIP